MSDIKSILKFTPNPHPSIKSIATALALAVACAAPALAAGSFTSAQADQGHQLFNNHCAECHRPDLTGALGPALKGPDFAKRWGGKPVEDFYQFEHANMPANAPGSLPKDQMLAITAYILKQNGLTPGSTPLSEAAAKDMKMPGGGG